jgi:hypothetical protein
MRQGVIMTRLRSLLLLSLLLASGRARAFHSGGVAECGGCHAMHRADSTGTILGASTATLLTATNVSDTCLGCHSGPDQVSNRVLTYPLPATGVPPVNRNPAGDFAWLSKTYSYFVRGAATVYSPGGHHVVAPDHGLTGLTETAPGGTFPGAQLVCSSCHDPHGRARTDSLGNLVPVVTSKIIGSGSYPTLATPATGEAGISAYGTYRLHYTSNSYYSGAGYAGPPPAMIQGGLVNFSMAPIAVAPANYNQSENVNQVVVRYGALAGRTFGLWCASCHPRIHSNTGLLVHPVDNLLSQGGEDASYRAYLNSGNKTGTAATAYLSLVPFAMSGVSRAALAAAASSSGDAASLVGPAPIDQVMCLSCHRGHASGFENDVRWEYEGEFITYVQTGTNNAAWPGTDTTPGALQFARGKTSSETQAAYYDRPVSAFGAYQRSLCNKCHLQD